MNKAMTVLDFQKMKVAHQNISMVTCYDFWSAEIVNHSNINAILVGDSLAMVMHGHLTTLPATVELITLHIKAVVKGAKNKFIVGDMPFCSYRKGLAATMDAVQAIMQAGANAIKLEGVDGNVESISHIVKSGVPVMGHIGLTPQSIHQLGGFKVQREMDKLVSEAKQLQEAGCFALVLECMPSEIATKITEALSIPTIGIGAGPGTSGQILVLQDMLGMNPTFKPKYLKTFLDGFDLIKSSLNQYDQDVKNSEYPIEETHGY